MNAPFKPDVVLPIMADACVSISELKRNPAAVIAEAGMRQVAILNRNKPVAYMISPKAWEGLCELVDDLKLAEEAQQAWEAVERGEEELIPVTLDELLR